MMSTYHVLFVCDRPADATVGVTHSVPPEEPEQNDGQSETQQTDAHEHHPEHLQHHVNTFTIF